MVSVFMDLHCVSSKDSNTSVKTNKEILDASFFSKCRDCQGTVLL